MSALTSMSLSELNGLVRESLSLTFPDEYWVTAEIHEMHVAVSGHCYAELVEKDRRSDRIVAKARAAILSGTFASLRERFEQATGQRFTSGIKVMVRGRVSFHEVYGFSFLVSDIDPTYTLGDLAQRRMEILRRLEEDGIRYDNQMLTLPRLAQRIAIVSSSTTAGYDDFMKHLAEHSGRLSIQTKLFEAKMQGDLVESSIIEALLKIDQERDRWDAVLIVRGGGATSDFNGFETYLLASAVAQFSLPVITAIGHERDNTVIDEVANTRLKTPTAAAAFIIDRMQREASLFEEQKTRLTTSVKKITEMQKRRMEQNAHRTYRIFTSFASTRRSIMVRHAERLRAASIALTRKHLHRIEAADKALQNSLRHIIITSRHKLDIAQKAVDMASPGRILQMGYSYTTAQGRVVKDANALNSGDIITTHLASGSVESIVSKKN